MNITIISATENPVDVIGIAAGTSYGKSDASEKRVRNVYAAGHMSCFEHASVTFRVDSISRACSHQLVRHRLASFVQKSQRYTKVDIESDWYVMPPAYADYSETRYFFEEMMQQYARNYQIGVNEGIKPEDARYLLPEACKTEITCTMNLRELYHFLNLRADSHAQWEIRDMAFELVEKVADISDQWYMLMQLWNLGDQK